MGNSLTRTSNSNSLAPRKQTFSNFMSSPAIKNKINDVVQGKDGQRFITALVSAVSTNHKLAECEHFSIFSAALLGESLKLSPSPQLGQYYLVPYKCKNVMQAQFQIGYKGYIQLAIRTGQYKRITPLAIKEGELMGFDPLTEELKINLIKDDTVREKTPTMGYYFSFELVNGFTKSMYWSYEKMLHHADTYSKAFNKKDYERLLAGKIKDDDLWKYSSFWYKSFDDMALKTLIRQGLSKWGVMSIDLQSAMINDSAVIDQSENRIYVDNDDISGFQERNSIETETEIIEDEIQENGQEDVTITSSGSLLDGIE